MNGPLHGLRRNLENISLAICHHQAHLDNAPTREEIATEMERVAADALAIAREWRRSE